jgi:two-component system, OmpR family, phosphate regulon sensor histidine kinase PhoR
MAPRDGLSKEEGTAQLSSNKLAARWHLAMRVSLFIVAVFAVFSLSYLITLYLYHSLGNQPGRYLYQMTMVGIAMFLLLVTGLIIGRVAEPQQRVFWQSLIDGIRQMAKGNFNVRIDENMVREPRGHHPFRQLVYSLNDMAQELAKLEQMREEFISNVSHEIQSPLTAILGFVEALKSEELTREHRRHYLNIIETESRRMSRLSENLLKLTSLESGSHPFHPESFRLDKQMREVVLSLEPLWMKKDIQIDLSLPSTHIKADKDLLSQVWINLVTNAIKFTEPRGSLSIALQVEDCWTIVCFRDTGSGMTEEDKHRIFERFYKADRSRSESGTGLGLAIARHIVETHAGRIWAESALGKGSSFFFTLPTSSQ